MSDSTSNNNMLTDRPDSASLGLSVKEQSAPPDDSFLLDPKKTAEWLAGLPLANIGETARRVYTTLLEFNRYQLPGLLRAKQAERFHQPVEYVCSNLQRHYLHTSFPLSEKGWKAANLSCELNQEMATAYKILIERMLAGENQQFDRKLLIIALHRALHYLGNVALNCALVYAPWPARLWKEINIVFAFAQQNRVHNVPIRFKVENKESVSTIEENFKALLFLAMSSPHHLRQTHILRIQQHALGWAQLAEISNPEPSLSPDGCFNIDLLADAPPAHNALHPAPPTRLNRVLDVRPLLKHLREEFENRSWESDKDALEQGKRLPRPLLRYLIINWNHPPDRRFVRTQLNFELNIRCGLKSIFDALVNEQREQIPAPAQEGITRDDPLASSPDDYSLPFSPPKENPLSGLSSDSLSLAPLSEYASERPATGPNVPDKTPQPSNENVEPNDSVSGMRDVDLENVTVTTLNESAWGYCINWPIDEKVPKVKVDELIGIASATQRGQYSLATVRWLRVRQGRDLDLGLQILTNRIQAGRLQFFTARGGRRKSNHPVDCLILGVTNTNTTSPTESLVMTTASFPIGADLRLSCGKDEFRIRLTRPVELNSAFAQFHFTRLATETNTTEVERSESGSEFDDLWSSL